MYLYNSLRAYTRSTPQHSSFVLLDDNDTDSSHEIRLRSSWDDVSETKVDGWTGSCRTSTNSTSPTTRGRFSAKKLREKIGINFSCFRISHLRNMVRIKPRPTASSSLKAMVPRKTLITSKMNKEKSIGDVQIRVTKPHFEVSEEWPTATIIAERELCARRPGKNSKKPRQITRYYSPRIVEARSPATIYYSNQRVQATRIPTNKSRAMTQESVCKSESVGKHLEWLKFLV